MASLSVKFQSLTWTLMSFSHNWKIKFTVAEYPPFNLFILDSHSLQNSCTATFISYLGGYVAGLTLAIDLFSSGCLLRVDVNPPWWFEVKCTWHGWLCNAHVASLASSFSKFDLPATRMSWEIPGACANAAPLLAFTIPGKILNASLWSSLIWFVEGTDISGILLCCSWTCSKIACFFSSRVERCLISLDWDLISLACCRCKWDRTNTCVWWAISSSIILANKVSFPSRAWVSAESWCKEALLWASSSCDYWALSPLCPMPSSILLKARALAGEELGSNCSGFIMALGDAHKMYLVLGQNWYFSFRWTDELCHEWQLN